jgi:uncharacterized protein (TIGR03435 family)
MTNKFTRKPGFGNKALLASAAVLAVTGAILMGLMIPVHSNAQTSAGEKASSQSGETSLRFEVASVKRCDPSRGGFGQPLTCSPGRCAAEKISLAALAMHAYGTKEAYQIEWAFPWMASEPYDIAAKVADGATTEQVHIMLQRLLAERFGLVVHRETRQLPGFRLVVAKGGAKLRKCSDVPASAEAPGPAIVTKDGTPQFSSSAKSGMLLTLAGEILRGRRENMSGLAHQLVLALHVPVIDATGLEGAYDYDLSFAPEVAPVPKGSVVFVPPGAGAAAGQVSPAPPSDQPAIFAAIKQQLGLPLEALKSVPVEVLVLDKASREPTVN